MTSFRRPAVVLEQVRWPVSLPPGDSLGAACLADLLAESRRGEPREFGVSVDAFTGLAAFGGTG
jgi:hypothetical protein